MNIRIAGYFYNKLHNTINCDLYKNQLLGEKILLLSELKNRGPYLNLIDDVYMITCKVSESTIWRYTN